MINLDPQFWQDITRRCTFRVRSLLRTGAQRAREFRKRRSLMQTVSPVLVIVGAVLLGYVGGQYGEMFYEQHQLAQKWEQQQQARHAAQPKLATTVVDDGLTRLSVPKIDLDSVVVEGTTYRSLLLGPGHMKETPAPGETGNSVITGHRDTFFRHIHELEKGDIVLVQREGKTFRYQVVGKKIVEPDDMSVVRPATDSELTLITCYPTYYIGPAPKRLVVFSKLIGEPDAVRASTLH